KVAEAYGRYVEVSERLRTLKARLEDSRRKRELLEYEVSEIDKAALSPGEDDKLREEIAMIQHSEQIYEAVSESYEALFGGEGGADLALGNAMNRLSQVSGFSQEIGDIEAAVSDAYYQIEDLSSRLRKVRDSVSFSEAELDTKTERLELIEALKRKYGGSLTAVLEYADKARQELKLIDSADDELKALEAGISEAKASYVDAANKLTTVRKKAASELETGMAKELAELAFADARLLVKLGLSAPSARGSDAVEFLMSANRGEEPRPLAKIASGGELSRIMLAFKRMIGDLDDIPTMIFDEIDTGISGATAGVVGKKLKEISKTHQIVCITHLPQIACQADRHFRIAKYSDEISTHTTVDPLGETERIDEIARLLSASEITEAARAQARVLIASASTDS
ncbi:MAG: hypothetical protein II689_03205, partial [Firmicutes bacterium]|nr:hypothetical protein [Bacillota bacterium]